MLKKFTNPDIDANFGIATEFNCEWVNYGSYLMFLWNDGNIPIQLLIDDREVNLSPNRITCVTYHNKVKIDNFDGDLKILFFNREFYCVHTYDSEVSCNGLLFFGSNISPVLHLNEEETDRLRTLFEVLKEEFTIHDSNQEEMLRILLKRYIIRCTRMAKKQLLRSGVQTRICTEYLRHIRILGSCTRQISVLFQWENLSE